MPPSHRTRPEALPSDRLRVGDCVVEVPLREITRADGSKTRVTAKSMAVLMVLAEHAGHVVGREALLESVWAGTMPTDDVVTQAITLLRKALGDDRDAPAYVETIPKSGYRLLAGVEWLVDAGGAPAPGVAQGVGRRVWRWGLPIAVGGVLLSVIAWACASGAMRLRRRSRRPR